MKTRLRLLLSAAALTVMSTTAAALPEDGSPVVCNPDQMGTAYVIAMESCGSRDYPQASITSCQQMQNGSFTFNYVCWG